MNTYLKKYYQLSFLLVLLLLLTAPLKICCAAEYLPSIPDMKSKDSFPDLYYKVPCIENSAVLAIQESLFMLGYNHVKPSGIYDKQTVEAVKLFQSKTGLAPDGIVKYHVWIKIIDESRKMSLKKDSKAPPTGNSFIVIDTFRRRLTVFNDNTPYAKFPIAIGKAKTPSPIGNWKIINKGRNWGTGFGTRWLGLNVPWGTYGIHGTNKPWSIGSMASHGCFRMWNKDVEVLYSWIKHGTPVHVVGNPFGYMSGGMKKLKNGDKNSAVEYIQSKLQRRGFYQKKADGIFGYITEQAVKKFQKHYKLDSTGHVGHQEYLKLGL